MTEEITSTGGRQLQFYRQCRHKDAASHYFIHPDDHVDIFMNTFRMDHDIDLRYRLCIEDYTISASDLLISKLQIHKINEKDIRDILTIIKDLSIGEIDQKRVINISYIAGLCSRDWGMFQDVTANIIKCLAFLPDYQHYPLNEKEKQKIQSDFDALLKRIDGSKKSMGWKIRARLGKKVAWYREVEAQDSSVSDLASEIQKHPHLR